MLTRLARKSPTSPTGATLVGAGAGVLGGASHNRQLTLLLLGPQMPTMQLVLEVRQACPGWPCLSAPGVTLMTSGF